MLHRLIQLAALPMIVSAASLPLPTFGVSTDLHPAQAYISNPWGTTARPLARAQDNRHHYVDFVANELIIITANESDILPLFPAGGTNRLLTKVLPPKGDPNYPATMYLISVDSSTASTASLVTDVRKIDPLSTGNLLISSTGALKTLALAAHEQASGIKTSLNYVLRPNDYRNWTASDGVPSVPGPDQVWYTADSFQWPYNCQLRHATDPTKCVQDIGVAAAWRALYFAQKLSNRVNVNIYDSGFVPNRDFPPGYQILPASSTNEPGPGTCPTDPCPFHGTNVTMAGFAVPNNGFGGTGPGGPVAQLTMVSSPNLDLFEIIQSIWNDIVQLPNTKILNLSFSADIPAALCLGTCQLMDLIGDGLRAAGMLVVASAGNDGSNVDDSVGICPACVETAKTIPCEMSGVLCVGGIDWNVTTRALKSNWGSDSTNPSNGGTVRLFAPFDVFMYDQHAGGGIYVESGTSYSAPFVAGVAALVWAANPSLSPGDVENVLITTAHKSADTSVNRYVDAFNAVKTALGGHLAPSILITTPAPNSTFHYDQPETFIARATDEDTGADISSLIKWSSDEPGEVPAQIGACPQPANGLGGTTLGCAWEQKGFTLDPTHPVHTFTATIVYNGYTVRASVPVTIIDYPLTLQITNPDGSKSFHVGETVYLGYKAMRGTYPVPATDISWKVQNLDPSCYVNCTLALAGTATSIPSWFLHLSPTGSPENYMLFLNCQGQSASIALTIYPKLPPPHVTISQPQPGLLVYAFLVGGTQQVPIYQVSLPVHLAGSATDYLGNVVPGTNLTWFRDAVAGPGIGTGNAIDYTIQVNRIGTFTDPVQVPIILQATSIINGIPSTGTATVIINVVTL